jgi:hypothetical protein
MINYVSAICSSTLLSPLIKDLIRDTAMAPESFAVDTLDDNSAVDAMLASVETAPRDSAALSALIETAALCVCVSRARHVECHDR